jgi:hypothetical protein
MVKVFWTEPENKTSLTVCLPRIGLGLELPAAESLLTQLDDPGDLDVDTRRVFVSYYGKEPDFPFATVNVPNRSGVTVIFSITEDQVKALIPLLRAHLSEVHPWHASKMQALAQ